MCGKLRNYLDFESLSDAGRLTATRKWKFGESIFTSMALNQKKIVGFEWHFLRLFENLTAYFGGNITDWNQKFSAKIVKFLRAHIEDEDNYLRIEFFLPLKFKSNDDMLCFIELGQTEISSGPVEVKPEVLIRKPNVLNLLKTSNYMETEYQKKSYQEFFWVNQDNQLIESSSSSILLIKGSRATLMAPERLKSVTENVVKKILAAHKMEISYSNIAFNSLHLFDEIILMNAVKGIRPVTKIGRIELKNWSEEGSIYNLLKNEYNNHYRLIHEENN